MRHSQPHRVKNPPAPTPTPHVGPFVMSVEFPTPSADEPTYRVPYEEVPTLEQAVAWIRHPPFPPETLKKLKKGVLLTARVRAEWVMENGQHGEEIAAMGLVLRAGTKNFPAKIALVTRDGITADGKAVDAQALRLVVTKTRDVAAWLNTTSTTEKLLRACEGVPRPLLTLTACAVARTVLHLVTAGDDRPRVAIETAEEWAYGRATLNQVKKAENYVDRYSSQAAAKAAASTTWHAQASAKAADAAWYTVRTFVVAEAEHAPIVRGWIGLPGLAFAAITRTK